MTVGLALNFSLKVEVLQRLVPEYLNKWSTQNILGQACAIYEDFFSFIRSDIQS